MSTLNSLDEEHQEKEKRPTKRAICRRRTVNDALSLKGLRRIKSTTQTDLAKKLQISQSSVSSIESQKNPLISTIESYVWALNGKLEIFAKFPDGESHKISLAPASSDH